MLSPDSASLSKQKSLSNQLLRAVAKEPHPSDYLSDVEQAAGDKLGEWRRNNLISDDAYLAALDDDYDLFLEARAETIHEALVSLVQA